MESVQFPKCSVYSRESSLLYLDLEARDSMEVRDPLLSLRLNKVRYGSADLCPSIVKIGLGFAEFSARIFELAF